MPVMSQGWSLVSWVRSWNVASGEFHFWNISAQPQYWAMSLNMLKSESAWPGARAIFLTRPMRLSELMKVPSFSPQLAAGRTRSALMALSVVEYMSWTTRKSSFCMASLYLSWWIHEWAPLVAMTQRPLIFPSWMPWMIWS